MDSDDITLKNMKSRLRKNSGIQLKVVAEEPDLGNSVHDEDNVPLVELPRVRKSDDCNRNHSTPTKKGNTFLNNSESRGRTTPKVHYFRHRNASTSTKNSKLTCKGAPSSTLSFKTKANLALLGINTLWRYWRYFNLGNFNPNPSEEEMFNAVQQHFAWQQLEETEVIGRFINSAKRLRLEDTRVKEEPLHDQYLMDEWVQS